MSDSLYADPIMELTRKKPEKEKLENPRASASIDNPLCGDRITIEVDWDDTTNTLTEVAHKVRGCALCVAAANLISQVMQGEKLANIVEIQRQLEALLKNQTQTTKSDFKYLDVFIPAQPHKSRHECVLLPFKALNKALSSS